MKIRYFCILVIIVLFSHFHALFVLESDFCHFFAFTYYLFSRKLKTCMQHTSNNYQF